MVGAYLNRFASVTQENAIQSHYYFSFLVASALNSSCTRSTSTYSDKIIQLYLCEQTEHLTDLLSIIDALLAFECLLSCEPLTNLTNLTTLVVNDHKLNNSLCYSNL